MLMKYAVISRPVHDPPSFLLLSNWTEVLALLKEVTQLLCVCLKISPQTCTLRSRDYTLQIILCVIQLKMPSGRNLRRRRDSSEDEEDDIADELRWRSFQKLISGIQCHWCRQTLSIHLGFLCIHLLICVLFLFVYSVNVAFDLFGCLDRKLKRQKSCRVCGNGRPESGISHCLQTCENVNAICKVLYD